MIKKIKIKIRKFLISHSKYLKNQKFIYILSIVIGLLSGIVTVIIKNTVHFVEYILVEKISLLNNYIILIYPFLGITLTVIIIRYFIRESVGHGIPMALYAISKGRGNMSKKNMFSSILTSAITVGFGGSTGLEGPTVATTSAIGSNIGKLFRFNYKTKTLLIACAAAGALSAIFKAPIAAIIFAIEVIMIDLTAISLIPLLLASVSSIIISKFFLGNDTLFHFELIDVFNPSNLPFYFLLGILCGLMSIYFTSVYFNFPKVWEKLKNNFSKAIVGGIIISVLIFLFPALYGEGYQTINNLILNNLESIVKTIPFLTDNHYSYWIITLFLGFILLLKPIATTTTIRSGGIGGIFAPTLFMGSLIGTIFTRIINGLNISVLSTSNFTLVAMGGLMAGILQAPLTAIFLIAEITGGYELFTPLMFTTAISYITVKFVFPHSVYNKQLAERGELITHHKDQAILTLMDLKNEIETNFNYVFKDQKLIDLVKVVAQSSRNLFPVLNSENELVGIITLDDIRNIMFDSNKHNIVLVNELMHPPPDFIYLTDSMESVMKKFEITNAWNLPVLNDGKYIGFVSKSKLFNTYREMLCEFYDLKNV